VAWAAKQLPEAAVGQVCASAVAAIIHAMSKLSKVNNAAMVSRA